MANPHRGEVEFQACGFTYKLKFSTNALAELEEKLDMSVNEIGRLMGTPEKFRMKMLKDVMWAGLRDSQPGITEADVTRILREQLPTETSTLVSSAFALAFPQPAEGAGDRPPEAGPAGNGSDSSHPTSP